MCEGIAAELAGIDLGDKRLNKRSQRIIEALSVNPEASCNAACEGWSDTLAAYRLFDNQSFQPEEILQPHGEATKRRMRQHPVVVIAQDTTELDYSKHPPTDARCLNRECPSLPCDVVFDACEWKSVWRVVTRKELPRTPPTLGEFMALLTHLGGYNNRKTEAPPGPQPVWVGIRRMADLATAWLSFGPGAQRTYV